MSVRSQTDALANKRRTTTFPPSSLLIGGASQRRCRFGTLKCDTISKYRSILHVLTTCTLQSTDTESAEDSAGNSAETVQGTSAGTGRLTFITRAHSSISLAYGVNLNVTRRVEPYIYTVNQTVPRRQQLLTTVVFMDIGWPI
jgi:hypothetical protein